MKSSGTGETCPIALMSRGCGSIGGIIKRIANEYGFLWRELPDFPLVRDAAIVLVAPAGDEKMFGVLSDKCGVWDEKKQTACACYELEVGNGDDSAVSDKESLTDWILTEYDFYGRKEIGFEGADGLSAGQLQEFETMLERALQELIKSFATERRRQ